MLRGTRVLVDSVWSMIETFHVMAACRDLQEGLSAGLFLVAPGNKDVAGPL